MTRLLKTLALTAALVPSTMFGTTHGIGERYPFTLSPEQFSEVEKVGCSDPYQLVLHKFNAYSRDKENLFLSGVGLCYSHRRIGNHPVFYKIECYRYDLHPIPEGWICSRGQGVEVIDAIFPAGHIFIQSLEPSLPDNLPLEDALRLVNELYAAGAFGPQLSMIGDPLGITEADYDQCSLEPKKKGPQMYAVVYCASFSAKFKRFISPIGSRYVIDAIELND